MSLSARPPPITTYNKTTNIYVLVTFCTDSWRRPWERRCTFNTFWSSDGPLFRHLHHGGLKRYNSLRLTRVSRTPNCWDVGSSNLQTVPGLPLRKPRLRHRPARHTTPPRGRPPTALGRTTTSTTRHLHFISSKLSAQTPL